MCAIECRDNKTNHEDLLPTYTRISISPRTRYRCFLLLYHGRVLGRRKGKPGEKLAKEQGPKEERGALRAARS